MENKDIIAIDFGTTNTYITYCQYGTRNKIPLMFGGRRPEISTALLYSDVPDADPAIYPIIGNRAVVRFGTEPSENVERKKYRFSSHFKPNIANSEDARQNAIAFFQGILRDAQKQSLPFYPLGRRVIIGVPCEAGHEYRETLIQIAREAGYGDVELMDEPIGAILHDLGNNLFPLAALLAGTLVVDFGGGTCDYVYMKNGDIKKSWGDMNLGGQLFDDVFYQWFREQNPQIVEELERAEKDFLVRSEYCRAGKENFSDEMNHGHQHVELIQIGEYGRIQNLSRKDFEQRARNYAPSESLLKNWEKFRIPVPENLRQSENDLIRWFQDSLLEGLSKAGIGAKDIHVVSLSGGSSLWYFVREFCVLRFGKEGVITSPTPYAAISEGLAIYSAIQNDFINMKKSLVVDQSTFIEKTIVPGISDSFDHSRDDIVSRVLPKLFDEKVVPILKEYREKGGTILFLKDQLEKKLSDSQKELENIVDESLHKNMDGLYNTSLEKTRNWLLSHNLRMADVDAKLRHDQHGFKINAVNPVDLSAFVHLLNALIVTITASIVASICGGAGWAIIMAGPGGLVIGFIIAAVAVVPILFGFKKQTQNFFEKNLPVPSLILSRFALTDKKIQMCRRKLEQNLKHKIDEQKESTLAELKENLSRVIQDEIDRLGIVNVILNNPNSKS